MQLRRLRILLGPILSLVFVAVLLRTTGLRFNTSSLADQARLSSTWISQVPNFPLFPSSWRNSALQDKSDQARLNHSADVVVALIEKPTQAWNLGALLTKVENLPKEDSLDMKALLNEAACVVLNVKETSASLTVEQLQGLYAALSELENDHGTGSRIRGVFSLVNLMAFVAVVGMVAVLGPCLAIWFRPLFYMATRFVTKVVIPVVLVLHRRGAFELSVYAINCWLILEGLRWPGNGGLFIAFFGVLNAGPAFVYSTSLFSTSSGSKELFAQVLNGYMFAFSAPLAVLFSSELFGWVSIFALYSMLGFSAASYMLCFAIGFNGRNATQRCLMASVLLLAVFLTLRFTLPHWPGTVVAVLSPFSSPVMIFGTNILFLAELIVSSRMHSRGGDWLIANILSLLTVVVGVVIGNVFTIAAIRNTATTWGALFVFDKLAEVSIWRRNTPMLLLGLLLSFATLFACSLFLNSHTEWVGSMFDGAALLPAQE